MLSGEVSVFQPLPARGSLPVLEETQGRGIPTLHRTPHHSQRGNHPCLQWEEVFTSSRAGTLQPAVSAVDTQCSVTIPGALFGGSLP